MNILLLEISDIKDIVLIAIPILTLIVTSLKDIFIRKIETRLQIDLQNVIDSNDMKIKKLENKLQLNKELEIIQREENRKDLEEVHQLLIDLSQIHMTYYQRIDLRLIEYFTLKNDLENTEIYLNKIENIKTMYKKFSSTCHIEADGVHVYNKDETTKMRKKLSQMTLEALEIEQYDLDNMENFKRTFLKDFHDEIFQDLYTPLRESINLTIIDYQHRR
jgi:carboxypeptidase C (cathepsin A)